MLRRTLVAFAGAMLVLLASLHVAGAAVISIGLYTVPPNTDPFAVPILITGGVEVTGWSFDLTYDPTDLQINTGCDPFTDPYEKLGKPKEAIRHMSRYRTLVGNKTR